MEKIQSALAKARAARGDAAASPPGPAGQATPSTGLLMGGAAREAPAPPPPSPQASPGRAPASDRARTDVAWGLLPEVTIPQQALDRAHVVAAKGGGAAAPFDMMRTKLLHQMRANGWKRVAITSPGPSCGKSTIALNLAFSLARQPDLRILLADADLHRPALARTLGQRPTAGLAEVIEGRAEPEDTLLRCGPNLAILPTVGARRNPADLFQSDRAAPALAAVMARYEPTLAIFDMPPMLIGDDVMAFMEHVDCALLVAAAEATTVKEIDACERELATRTNVLGVVLNKCRYIGREEGYYAS